MKRKVILLTIFIGLIIIDILSKYFVYHNVTKMSWSHPFYPFGGIGVFENFLGISFSINLVENTGAAWGLFSKYPYALFFIRLLIIIALIIYLFSYNKDKKRDLPLLLIITGALGNIIDFIFYKKVIDMFHFKFWGYSYPIFNCADIFITIGITWLIVTFFIAKVKSSKNEN